MEVHIRNVPQQTTENNLRKFLRPHLSNLSIRSFNCQKHRDRTFASLTFLHISDGERFLYHHGQTRSSNNRQPTRTSNVSVNLKFYSRPIYCEKSSREADARLLRVLEKEEKDRHLKINDPDAQSKPPTVLPVKFETASLSCGVWDYYQNDLVFSPQLTIESPGRLVFGERSAILTLDTGRRVDFRYLATLGITAEEGRMPSFIFSMCECPRLFEKIQGDPVAALMEALRLQLDRNQPKLKGAERHRIPCLSEEHAEIAGCCLVYRIVLSQNSSPDPIVGDKMHSLQKARGLPLITRRRTSVRKPAELYSQGFNKLQEVLSSSKSNLPFAVNFQAYKLARNGYLSPHKVLQLLPHIQNTIRRSSEAVCVASMRKLFTKIPFAGPDTEADAFKLETLVELLSQNEEACKLEVLMEKNSNAPYGNVAIVHRVKVTPSGIVLYGPEPESSNRVLRKYPNHHGYFIRVQFCDEDSEPVRFNSRVSNAKIFHERFKSVLNKGISIAGRVYEFLGFSHSSLRAQSVWFMAPFIHDGRLMYDRIVIQELGSFSIIRSPAKCAARIGQAFSDTRTAVRVDPAVRRDVIDVERKDRCFSDGVGTISSSLMEKICAQLPKAKTSKPTCFQIRFQGVKGMIALDSRLHGEVLVVRPSMDKFGGSTAADIEICEAAYRPLPMYLNRQLIKILEDMGVPDSFFLNLQAEELRRLRAITTSPFNASTFIKRQSIGEAVQLPWLINRLSSLNINFRVDGFLRDVVEMALLIELRLLKHKTRIPVQKGWHLHGLMDETGLLEEGQIFCIATVEGVPQVIQGKDLIVSRAPALHPGDVQMVEGILPPDDSPLMKLRNCICFSQKGNRDLPSMLSGGDLDGDQYYIMWDPKARPETCFKPADYPRQPAIDIGRPVHREDMTDFFVKFMETDQLGRIAVAHRILADDSRLGTRDADCITLAEMHSTAVDFSKTGIPVDMSKMPRVGPWRPDFEAPGPHVRIEKRQGICFEGSYDNDSDREDQDDDFSSYRYYESTKVLGKLYRGIDERKVFAEIQHRAANHSILSTSTVITKVWEFVQNKCRLIQWEHKKEWAEDIRDMYEDCLQNIMTEYSSHPLRPLTELEAFIGNILGQKGAQSKRQRELSTSMKEKFEVDAKFVINCIVKDGTEYSEEALERSMACLAVSLEDRVAWRGKEQLLSFKYVAAAVCLRELDFAGL